MGTQYKRVSYNIAHVGKGIETHAKSAEAAFSPLRVVASGMHAGKRALEDRNELRAAIAEAQTAVQEKREKYRVFGPEVLSFFPPFFFNVHMWVNFSRSGLRYQNQVPKTC